MRHTYDAEADALYVYLREDESVVRSIVIDEGRTVDIGSDDRVVGVEVLGASEGVSFDDIVGRFSLESFADGLGVIAQEDFRLAQPA